MKSELFYTICITDRDGTHYLHAYSMTEATQILIDYLSDKDDVYGFEIKVRTPN